MESLAATGEPVQESASRLASRRSTPVTALCRFSLHNQWQASSRSPADRTPADEKKSSPRPPLPTSSMKTPTPPATTPLVSAVPRLRRRALYHIPTPPPPPSSNPPPSP